MKNDRFCRLSAIAIAVTVSVAFMAASSSRTRAATPAGSDDSKFGTTLLYEVVASGQGKVDPTMVEKAVQVLNRRVNTGWLSEARIRATATGQIEIGIFDDGARKANHIQKLIERNGTLEFRILANSRDHQELIDRARNEPKKKELKDEKGALLARWVLVRPKEIEQLRSRDVATREVTGGGEEVLVVTDRFNVNGAHLKEVKSAMDAATAQPLVAFTFDSKGGELFGKFTGENVPTADGSKRQLAIIVDDCVWTAPSINSRVGDSGQIAGNFTQLEVDDLVAVLRSGTLPCKIKLVSKREHVEAKK